MKKEMPNDLLNDTERRATKPCIMGGGSPSLRHGRACLTSSLLTVRSCATVSVNGVKFVEFLAADGGALRLS